MENMRVIALNHKVNEKQSPEAYLGLIARAVDEEPNIVLGPDYGLSFLDERGKIRFDLRDKVIGELEKISSCSPKTLIVPGTCPVRLGEGKMGHSSLIFRDGRNLAEFRKETCVGDAKMAENNGLEYVRGCSDGNHLTHEGKIVAVEICSDHGKQAIPKDTGIELIQAYDDNAGFYIRPRVNDFGPHWAVLCDGRKPLAEAFRYDPSQSTQKLKMLKGKEIEEHLRLFELNESLARSN